MENNLNGIDYRELREKANFLRYSFVEEIEKHLLSIESNFLDHGMNVRWVQNEDSLCQSITDLLPQKQYNRVGFDLPKIPEYFSRSGNLLQQCTIESVTNKESEIDTLVVNADFAFSSNGSLVFVDKASRDCFNVVNNIIVILNIEDILISHEHLSLFLMLKNKNGEFPKDVKIISKPFERIEADAFQSSETLGYSKKPINISVLLYENGMSEMLNDISLRDSLYCIKCGRCMEVCPVANASNKMSPIELIKTNCVEIPSKRSAIFQQTTLCGNCQDVCPMNIPMTDMLIYEMNLVNGMNNYSRNKQLNTILSKRSKLNQFNKPLFRYVFVKRFFGKSKMLYNYFKNQNNIFYNIVRNNPEQSDE